MALGNDPFTRDEMGRFATSSSPNGGGTPNFGGDGFEYPETRDVLLKGATSRPSTAPTMTGGSDYEPPEPFDAHAALSEVKPGQGEPPSTNTRAQLWKSEAAPEGEPDFSTALRAGGYTPGEHAGQARPDLSQHLTPEMPPPVPNTVTHPAPRINFGSFGNGTPNAGGAEFGEADTSIGGGNGGV